MRSDSEGVVGCVPTAVIVGFLCLLLGGCYGCSKVQVADGFRDSTFRKLSNTGIAWKTNEAEFIENDAFQSRNFTYTVRDPKVAEALKNVPPNQRLRVFYEKYATAWFPNGASRYVITRIERLP